MAAYLKFGPSLGEGETIGIELAYQRQSWKDFFGYGAELEISGVNFGGNLAIAGRPYFDFGAFVGGGMSVGKGVGRFINLQFPAVHTNPISLYTIYLYAKFLNLIR